MPYEMIRERPHSVLEVYLTQVLYGIGISLVTLFIPIYLIELGYSVNQALLYMLVHYATCIVIAPFVASIASRWGLQRTTLIRIPFFLVNFGGLYALSRPDLPMHFLIPGIFGAVSGLLYWLPMHALFTRFSHDDAIGKEVGILQGLPALFRTLTPALGGVIAVSLGFPTLIIIALCIVCVSTVPLFVSAPIKANATFRFRDLFSFGQDGFLALSVIEGFATIATAVLFPLLIYFSLKSTASVGYIKTLGNIVFALAALAVGKRLTRKSVAGWLAVGSLVYGLSILPRAMISTAAGLSGIIIFGALSYSLYNTSYVTEMFSIASRLKERGDEFIVLREMFLNLGRVGMLALCIMLPWEWGFFFAGSSLLLSWALITYFGAAQ